MWQLYKFVVPKIIPHWEDVAYLSLHYDPSIVERIEASHKSESKKKCCQILLKDWLTTNNGVGPKTWETLLKQLKEVEELTASVEDIKKNLSNTYIK